MDDVDQIRLTVPATPSYARVVRLAIAGLASRSGFGYDDVEDLRIATGEVVGVLVADAPADSQLTFVVHVAPLQLALEASRTPAAVLGEVSELTRTILAGVVDEVAIDGPGGSIRLRKQAEER